MIWLLLAVIVALLILAVPLGLIALWSRVSALERRVAELEGRPAPAGAPQPRVETSPVMAGAGTAVATAAPAGAAAPAAAPPESFVAPPPRPEAAPVDVAPTPPVAPEPTATDEAESWEVVLGTSWLNKIGVLVLVLGVGFLMAYSFARVGPGGRVALGYLTGAALLGAGVRLARRPGFTAYGQSLIAGGWAGVYFTTFAAHALPAARVIESDLVATAALLLVAAGMIAHAVHERARAMTVLAYIAAYAALAVTPLTDFSMLASIPLTLSLLVVAVRLDWPRVALVGLAATYALFVFRHGPVFAGGAGRGDLLHFGVLGLDWLLFEAADLVWRRRQAGLMAANAAGVLGAGLLLLPPDDPVLQSWLLGAVGAAYVASAAMRRYLARRVTPGDAAPVPSGFSSDYLAIAIAAALFAIVIMMRLDGPPQTTALLVEAELIVAVALSLGDRGLRVIGGVAAALTSLDAWFLLIAPDFGSAPWPGGIPAPVPALLAVVAAWHVNDAWIRRATGPARGLDRGYTWAALVLFVELVVAHGPADYGGVILLAAGALLAERSRAVPVDFLPQAALAAIAGALGVLFTFGPGEPRHASSIWIVLPAATALGYLLAWRIRAIHPASRTATVSSAVLIWAATAMLAAFEWHALPHVAAAPAWAISALVVGAIAARRARPAAGQAAGLLTIATLRTLDTIVDAGAATPIEMTAAAVVVAVLFAVGRVGPDLVEPGDAGRADTSASRAARIGRGVATVTGSILLMLLASDVLRSGLVTPAWGVEGLALLGVGFVGRDRALRLSGLGVLLASLLKLFLYDLSALEPLARILSFVVLGLVLLAVSWAYTRYREAIRKLL